MGASSPEELAEYASQCLQDIERQLQPDQRVGIRVPRGVIRTASQILPVYEFVAKPTTRRNIAYAVEALDFYRWIISRFHLYGPVRGYLYKTGLILVDAVIESVVRDALQQLKREGARSHKKNIEKAARIGLINEQLAHRLTRVHERRSNIHLHRVSELEATKYSVRDWNTAVEALREARCAIQSALLDNELRAV